MPDLDEKPEPIWVVRGAAAVIAASAVPALWSVAAYPIDKGTVYVGPITFFLGISLALWLFWSAVGCVLGLWIHLRKPGMRRRAWYLLCAGECAYFAVLILAGVFISVGLEGRLVADWLGTGLLVASLIGLVVSLRRAKGH